MALNAHATSESYSILIRVNHLTQLFHTLDPSPFRERDLDVEAEDYIVGWAQDAPANVPFAIVVQVMEDETTPDAERIVEEALHNNFDYCARRTTRELRELFRQGWRALMVGLPILAASLATSQLIAGLGGPWRIAGESLLILGWVANWRPIEIFLYGWWPIVRRRALYRRLAAARVVVRRSPSATPSGQPSPRPT